MSWMGWCSLFVMPPLALVAGAQRAFPFKFPIDREFAGAALAVSAWDRSGERVDRSSEQASVLSRRSIAVKSHHFLFLTEA